MRRSNRTTSGGGFGLPSSHHGHSPRRGERNPQRASGAFSSYDQGTNMERGMVLYDSSDEDSEMESDMMHRRGGRQEDLYRQSLHEYDCNNHQHQLRLILNSGFDSDEDVELARRSGGNGHGSYRAGNGRSDHYDSRPARRPLGRHAPGYNTIEEERPHMADQLVPGPRSNRGPGDGGRGVRTTNLPGFPLHQEHTAEWWAEENRRDRQSGQTTLGIWREGDDPEGDPVFVPNPTVDSSRIESYMSYRNARR